MEETQTVAQPRDLKNTFDIPLNRKYHETQTITYISLYVRTSSLLCSSWPI